MRLIELEERKQIQMQILDVVDEFCGEHNIKYSLSCGTLLGAIRHGGYIPWDDDIDIYMLREDYNRFEQEFPETYNGYLKLASLKRREDWTSMISKVYDDRTILKEHIIKCAPIGINIDIFPIDKVPEDKGEWLAFNKKRLSMLEFDRGSNRQISSKRPLWQNLAICLLKLRYIGYNRRAYIEKLEMYIQQFNSTDSSLVFETSSGARVKNPFPLRLFDSITEISFEDRKYKGFNDYHEYLTETFGDYMTPPPLDKRNSVHTYDSYWK